MPKSSSLGTTEGSITTTTWKIILLLCGSAMCQDVTIQRSNGLVVYQFGADLTLKKELSSESSKVGDKFETVAQHEILLGGKVLPKNTRLSGTVLYVDHFKPEKTHKREITVPMQRGRVGFELTRAVLPDGSIRDGLGVHLSSMSWQAPIWELNTIELSTPQYDGKTVNEVSGKAAIRVPAGSGLLVLEEDKLRPALYKVGSVEALAALPGIDTVSYLTTVTPQINATWKSIALSIKTGLDRTGGIATVEFDVAKDGELYNLRLVRSTNSRDHDLAGIKSLLALQHLPPLPSTTTDACLPIRMSFIYNTIFQAPENSLGPIVPVVVDRVIDHMGPLDHSLIASVLVDHTGSVKDAVVVNDDIDNSVETVSLVKGMRFSPYSQGLGFPLRHTIVVLPRQRSHDEAGQARCKPHQ